MTESDRDMVNGEVKVRERERERERGRREEKKCAQTNARVPSSLELVRRGMMHLEGNCCPSLGMEGLTADISTVEDGDGDGDVTFSSAESKKRGREGNKDALVNVEANRRGLEITSLPM